MSLVAVNASPTAIEAQARREEEGREAVQSHLLPDVDEAHALAQLRVIGFLPYEAARDGDCWPTSDPACSPARTGSLWRRHALPRARRGRRC